MEQMYDQLCKEIEELTFTIKEVRDEIEKYLKMGNVFRGPAGIKGVDYSADKVSTSGTMAFADAVKMIDEKEKVLQPYLEKLAVLMNIKKNLDDLYKSNQDTTESKVFYLRKVKKYTQKRTADILGYSTRQIQRIEKKINESKKDYIF